MQISDTVKGLLLVLAADILWGLSAVTAKFLFNNQVNPLDLTQMRAVISALILGSWLALRHPGLLRIDRRDIRYMLIFGLFGLSAMQLAYFFTISQTNVATAVFLEYLAPVFILLWELYQSRKMPSLTRLLILIAAMVGGFLIVKGTSGQGLAVTPLGLATGLISAVAFAFYILYSRHGLARYSPWTLLFYGLAVGALAWTFYRLPWLTFWSYQPVDWAYFLFIALFSTILPSGFFFISLRYLSPMAAGITSTFEPVAVGLIAYLLLGEVMTSMQIAGCALVVVAITSLQVSQ